MKIACLVLALVASSCILDMAAAAGSDWTEGKGMVLPLRNRLSRKLTRNAAGGPAIPLYGNLTFWGEFYGQISLGTPPQFMMVDFDTGSTDLIVYTPDCYGCPKKKYASFSCSNSQSCMPVWCDTETYLCNENNCFSSMDPCTWEDEYAGGSDMQGNVYKDVIAVGGVTTQGQIAFGGITSASFPPGQPFQPDGISGLAGLAFQPLSGFGASNWYNQFVIDYNWYDGYSMCLSTLAGGNGGVLAFGVDYSKDARFKFTPLTQSEWWNIALNDIKFGGKSLGLTNWDYNNEGVIVDSGTTLFVVTNLVMNAIKQYFTNMCATNPLVGVCSAPKGQSIFDGYCFPMTTAQVNAYPALTLNIPGWGDVTWESSFYLWQGAGIPGQYCMGIQALAPGTDAGIIIGDVLMQKFHIFFDRNNNQIGLAAKTTCPTPTVHY